MTKHKYIGKRDIDKVSPLTETYRKFCWRMKEVRYLNRRIVELLDKIGEKQKEEVRDYVKKGIRKVR